MINTNYRDKYTKSSLAGRLLVDHFFDVLRSLISSRGPTIQRVLEVGAGEGFSTRRIRKILGDAVYFEASEYEQSLAVIAAEKNLDVPIRHDSIYNLSHPEKSFDLVICLEVLEHLEHPTEGLRELARVASGYVILSVPREPLWRVLNMLRGKYWGTAGNTPGHVQHWSTNAIRRFVSPCFNIIETRTPIPWSMLLLAPKKVT